jgi:hypothetical protein
MSYVQPLKISFATRVRVPCVISYTDRALTYEQPYSSTVITPPSSQHSLTGHSESKELHSVRRPGCAGLGSNYTTAVNQSEGSVPRTQQHLVKVVDSLLTVLVIYKREFSHNLSINENAIVARFSPALHIHYPVRYYNCLKKTLNVTNIK